MARRRQPTTLAQPPWTYAPSEVSAWLASGAERVREEEVPRAESVTEISARCSPSVGARAVRRFDRLLARGVDASTRPSSPLTGRKVVREGRFAEARVRLVVHPKPDDVVLRLTLRPALSAHRARRLLTELGVDSREAVVR